MRVAIYVRVSTDLTGDKRQDPEMQVSELRQFCKHKGWEIYATYRDRESGKDLKRRNLMLLLDHARQKKFDIVLVWAIDRFSRSLRDLITTLDQLKNWGIRFVSYTQPIDTSDGTPMSEMLTHLLGMFAQFERQMIQTRVKAGMARAKAKGIRLGRKPLDDLRIGYILERHKAGDSLREIQRKYRDRWSKGIGKETIRRYLARMS